jgi:hypothetical protein
VAVEEFHLATQHLEVVEVLEVSLLEVKLYLLQEHSLLLLEQEDQEALVCLNQHQEEITVQLQDQTLQLLDLQLLVEDEGELGKVEAFPLTLP